MNIKGFLMLVLFALHRVQGNNQEAGAMVDGKKTADDQQQPRKTMAFDKDQLYRDFFPLSQSNFTKSVLHSRMAWVIFFHDGMLERSWKLSAVNYRGIIRFGMIDKKEEPNLVKELNLAVNVTARVYPYGGKIIKKKYYEDMIDAMKAVSEAEKSLPDKIPRMEEKGRVDDVLLQSYMSSPTRFPAIVLTRETSTPTLFRSLALRFERYFNFRLLRDPSVDKMRQLGLPTDFFYHVPGIVVLITENFEDEKKRRFYAVQYDKSSMGGDLSYPNCLMFLLQVNRQFRHTLPGDNQAGDEDIVKATDVLLTEQEIFDIKDEYFSKNSRTRMAAPAVPQKEKQKMSDPYLQPHTEEL